MAITQGSYSVGGADPGGYDGHYADLKLAFDDINTPFTGDITLTIVASHAQGAEATKNFFSTGIYTLKITSDLPVNGDVDGGHIITIASATIACIRIPSFSRGNIVIERLNIRFTSTTASRSGIDLTFYSSGTTLGILIQDCLIDMRNSTTTHGYAGILVNTTSASVSKPVSAYVFNCMVVGHRANSVNGAFHFTGNAYGPIWCENCVAQNRAGQTTATGFYAQAQPGTTIRNCTSTNGGSSIGNYYGITNSYGYNNLSDDATGADIGWAIGANNQVSVTMADEYTSTDPADGATWFEPKSTGSARDGGAAAQVPGNNHGAIETIARPHDTNKYSIGAKEYPSSPVITGHPSLEQVDEGTPASFTVVATDATGYQWEEGPLPGVGEARVFADMTGETSDVLDILSAGSSLHQYQYRCKVSNAAGEVTSDAAYLLINGLPEPGGGGATSPERPTVSLTGINGLELTFDVAGDADVFRAEVTDPTSQVAAYAETTVEGALVVTLPHENIEYVVSVYAGNFGSVVWSLPGYVLVILVAPSPVPSPPGEPLDISDEEPIFSDVDPELRTDHQGNILVLTNAQAMTASIENIFDMSPGELVMDPLFGGEMKNMIAQNIDRSSAAFVRMAINHSLKQDPRVKRDKLTVIPRPSERVFKVILEFSENEGYIRGLFETLLEK